MEPLKGIRGGYLNCLVCKNYLPRVNPGLVLLSQGEWGVLFSTSRRRWDSNRSELSIQYIMEGSNFTREKKTTIGL